MDTNFKLLLSSSSELPPIPSGIYYGQNEDLDAINRNIYRRNLTEVPLRPNMDARSITTRQSLYPTTDIRPHYKGNYMDFNEKRMFAPMQSMGPLSGFNVNDETQLRNQYFALQHGAEQSYYVPSKQSDLYNVQVASESHAFSQPFPDLFVKSQFTTEPPPFSDKIGTNLFHNCTQTQLRNL